MENPVKSLFRNFLYFLFEIFTLNHFMIKEIDQIQQAVDFISAHIPKPLPEIGLTLGSGLGAFADQMEMSFSIETASIPFWPASTVEGHRGRLVCGRIGNVPFLILQGRVHYYEGYLIHQVIFSIRVLSRLGIRVLVLTNAAGALNTKFSPGDLMLITDHINLMGTNPLIGTHDPSYGERFPDMSAPYDPFLIRIGESAAKKSGIRLKKGILAVTSGPSYETAAEIRMIRRMGGDAVCMSTVPEVIAGVQMGMRILGVSLITNMATGLSSKRLSHHEVKEVATKGEQQFSIWMKEVIAEISNSID
jgi:purine-nucleoside phosphorylase